ncbi:MAG: SURF1 family protein [Rhizobiaceae bacterium]
METAAEPVVATPRGRIPWITLAIGCVALAILIGLGVWQLERLAWKEGLLATIQERVSAPPIDLSEALANGRTIAEQEYRTVRLEGEFLHGSERHFLSTWQGEAGFNVYTPLKLGDGTLVFVNRGFVPYDRKDAATRAEGQVSGRVKLSGLLRTALAEKPGAMVPDNEPGKNVFYWKDLREMAASANLPADAAVLGLFVDADAAPNPGGLPTGGVTLIDMPNNHLQYAVTWFGLAAALVGVLAVWAWRRVRR